VSDVELIATAALANVEAVVMAGDNAQRAMEGLSPMWQEGTGVMPYTASLIDELYRRRKEAQP